MHTLVVIFFRKDDRLMANADVILVNRLSYRAGCANVISALLGFYNIFLLFVERDKIHSVDIKNKSLYLRQINKQINKKKPVIVDTTKSGRTLSAQ